METEGRGIKSTSNPTFQAFFDAATYTLDIGGDAAGGTILTVPVSQSSRLTLVFTAECVTASMNTLGVVEYNIVQADLGPDKGMVYRLRAGNMANKASADKLCAELSDRDIGCFVVRLPEATTAPVAAGTAASSEG